MFSTVSLYSLILYQSWCRFFFLCLGVDSSISASSSSSRFGGYAVPYSSGLYAVYPCDGRFALVCGGVVSGS